MLKIREISSKETTAIRSEVLRPGQPLSACIYPHDDDEETFHIAAYKNDEQACIASFYKEKHPDIDAENQYRFRGMATLEKFRRQGIASALLSEAFDRIKKEGAEMVWCNAREIALDLYLNLGMEIASEQFDIPGIGPHYLMKKAL